MNNILSSPSKDEISLFLEGINAPDDPVNTQVAAMAYLGMCRHEYMSVDWIICQYAYEESLANILNRAGKCVSNLIKNRIETYYQQKGYFSAPIGEN